MSYSLYQYQNDHQITRIDLEKLLFMKDYTVVYNADHFDQFNDDHLSYYFLRGDITPCSAKEKKYKKLINACDVIQCSDGCIIYVPHGALELDIFDALPTYVELGAPSSSVIACLMIALNNTTVMKCSTQQQLEYSAILKKWRIENKHDKILPDSDEDSLLCYARMTYERLVGRAHMVHAGFRPVPHFMLEDE